MNEWECDVGHGKSCVVESGRERMFYDDTHTRLYVRFRTGMCV